jgi:hypothetical protein
MKKLVIGSMILVYCALGRHSDGLGAQHPVPRGELRIVDKHPLN